MRSRRTTASSHEGSGNFSPVEQAEGSEASPGGKIGDRTQVVRVNRLESHGSESFPGSQLCEPVSSLRLSSLRIEQPQERQLTATNLPVVPPAALCAWACLRTGPILFSSPPRARPGRNVPMRHVRNVCSHARPGTGDVEMSGEREFQ